MEGLRRVVDTALAADVDLVLIAGDLFDSARVPQPAVDETVAHLARLRMPMVLVPGNHDCVDEQSIYRRVDLGSVGPQLHFAGDPAGEQFLFPDLSLAVWARGIEVHHPRHRPLAGYKPAPEGFWDIVVTHGHFTQVLDSYRSSPITPDDIAALESDYVALGHWHTFTDVSQGAVTAVYSGSPAEGVVLVTLDPVQGTSFSPLKFQ